MRWLFTVWAKRNGEDGSSLLHMVSTIPKRTPYVTDRQTTTTRGEDMRGWYLESKRTGLNEIGCRGGVGADGDNNDYELEIGAKLNASAEFISLLVHYDEVIEMLRGTDSPLAALLLQSIKRVTAEVRTSYQLSEEEG
jgi:hypothetical protein